MLAACTAVRDLRKKSLEPVVENEYKLLKILDRLIEIIVPRDVALLDVGRQQRRAFLLGNVDHILKGAPVSADQIFVRYREEILDATKAEVFKNIQRVLVDIQVGER